MNNLRKIKTITMCGKRYKFRLKRLKDARGLTDHPDTKGKTVYIDPNEKGKDLLATLIDELIHCCIFEISNEFVDEMSDSMAEVLWRAGYRLKGVDDQEKEE